MVVEGFISGLHKSSYHGFNVEFAEHRQYLPGDDIRHIDWKAAAKSDKLYLKEFEEESSLKSYVVLDTSASMAFPPTGVSKLDYGKIVAASLSYLLLRQRDAVGLVGLANDIVDFVPPRHNLGHLHGIVESLEKLEGQGRTELAETLSDVADRIPRRGLIIVISDLLQDRHEVLEGLRLLRHRKHDVIVFHVLSSEELEFPYKGYVRFQDLESHDRLLTDPVALRNEYLERMRDLLEFYREGCLEYHLDYSLLRTSDPLDKALTAFLHRRMNRLKG